MAAAAAAVAFVRRSCAISFFLFRYNNSSPFFRSYNNNLYFSTKAPSAKITPPPLVFTEDFFVSKYQFSPQIAYKLASVSARSKKPQNPDLILSCLIEYGFSNAYLERVVRHHPYLLSRCPERTVKPKFKILQDLGFSAAEATKLIGREPGVIGVSTRRIKAVVELLLETGKYDMLCISTCPVSLSYCVEKTYKPRLQVLKELERKGLIDKWPHLATLACMTDESFLKFVAPNINEVGEEFTAMMSASRKLETATGLTPSSDDM